MPRGKAAQPDDDLVVVAADPPKRLDAFAQAALHAVPPQVFSGPANEIARVVVNIAQAVMDEVDRR